MRGVLPSSSSSGRRSKAFSSTGCGPAASAVAAAAAWRFSFLFFCLRFAFCLVLSGLSSIPPHSCSSSSLSSSACFPFSGLALLAFAVAAFLRGFCGTSTTCAGERICQHVNSQAALGGCRQTLYIKPPSPVRSTSTPSTSSIPMKPSTSSRRSGIGTSCQASPSIEIGCAVSLSFPVALARFRGSEAAGGGRARLFLSPAAMVGVGLNPESFFFPGRVPPSSGLGWAG